MSSVAIPLIEPNETRNMIDMWHNDNDIHLLNKSHVTLHFLAENQLFRLPSQVAQEKNSNTFNSRGSGEQTELKRRRFLRAHWVSQWVSPHPQCRPSPGSISGPPEDDVSTPGILLGLVVVVKM